MEEKKPYLPVHLVAAVSGEEKSLFRSWMKWITGGACIDTKDGNSESKRSSIKRGK